MSITASTKKEILTKRLPDECCYLAFLSAVVHSAGSLVNVGGGGLAAEIPGHDGLKDIIAPYVSRLYEVSVAERKVSGKSILRLSGDRIRELLSDLGILSAMGTLNIAGGIDKYVVMTECCISAYAKGAFLGTGSLSIIKKGGYHLQFRVTKRDLATDLAHLLAQVGILSRIIEREGGYLVYIKDSQNISDALALIGAERTVLHLHNNIIEREVSRACNRDNNCEMANLTKTISKSVVQCDAISKLTESGVIETQSDDVQALARLRVDNPESSYGELASLANMSKSAVKYKLDKLVRMTV